MRRACPSRLLRLAPVTALVAALVAAPAHADPDPVVRIVEDGALGVELNPDHPLVGGAEAALAACAAGPKPATGSPLFWLEISRAGKVSGARVHGSGPLDGCLARALQHATISAKLPAPIIVVGHLDLMAPGTSKLLPSPRMSTTPVVLDPHGSAWQLTVTRLAYTANRALDISAALDQASAGVAACAPRRGKSAKAAQAVAWTDGTPVVRSGTPAYDTCVAHALAPMKLPAPESALWLQLEIKAPGEALAAITDRPSLSHDQALRDALTTAVRSRKLELLACLDGHHAATVTHVGVALRAGKAELRRVGSGEPEVDTCVRRTFGSVAVPSASAGETADLDVSLDPE